jgi:hypothetical protein
VAGGNGDVDCIIVSNAPLNEASYAQRQLDIRNELPEEIRQFLEQDEQELATDSTTGAAIYRKLIGTSDTHITGEMKNWDALQRIDCLSSSSSSSSSSSWCYPCLFITGTNDTIPHQEYKQLPTQMTSSSSLSQQLPRIEVLVLENGEHAPFYGETAPQYFREIQGFLQRTLSNSSTD